MAVNRGFEGVNGGWELVEVREKVNGQWQKVRAEWKTKAIYLKAKVGIADRPI